MAEQEIRANLCQYLGTLLDEPLVEQTQQDKLVSQMMVRSLSSECASQDVVVFPDSDVSELMKDFHVELSEESAIEGPRDSISSDDQTPAALKSKKRKSMTQRYREERSYLERRIAVLKRTLDGLKKKRDIQRISAGNCSWKGRALEEASKRKQSMQLNARLRKAIEQQLEFAKSITKVLEQQPQIDLHGLCNVTISGTDFGSTDEDRRIAMHRIVDKVYQDLVVNGNKHKPTRTAHPVITIGGVQVSITNSFDFEITKDEIQNMDYRKFSDIFFTNGFSEDAHFGFIHVKILQHMDEELIYMQKTITGFSKYGGPIVSTNVIKKRYREATRDIVVWTSIDKDDKFPIDPRYATYQDYGFEIFERLESPGSTKDKAQVRGKTTVTPFGAEAFYKQEPGVSTENILNGIRETYRAFQQLLSSHIK